MMGTSAVSAQSAQEVPGDTYRLKVVAMDISGNVRVERAAIVRALMSKVGAYVDAEQVADDIRSLYAMGFFSQVEIRTVASDEPTSDPKDIPVRLVVNLEEKPAIVEIAFKGFDGVSSDDVSEKLNVKTFTIVDEGLLGKDLKIIEDMHKEKGYFLARASYQLIPLSADSVLLEFQLDLGTKMYIGDVNIVGNKAFNDAYLLESMLSRPFDRYATLFGSPFFQQAFVDRDEQFLSFIYQDAGYAQMKVTKTLKELSQDQRFVNLTFTVDEGQKYHFGDISFEGDLLFSKKELHEYVGIAAGDLFRISRFRTAVENLERAYGDLGYAFVDVDPQTTFDTKNRRVGMKYVITSGKKAYFGRVRIIGNTKTRDNVIRRELSILDGELFGRTALDDSKSAVESLGFFEEVRFIRRLDTDDESIIHYTVKVKEKATGQVQASIGYTPGGNTDATWFGQGKYEEQNQSGRAWNLGLTATYSDKNNYGTSFNFSNPRLRDSQWSLGFSLGYKKQTVISLGFDIVERSHTAGFRVGRKIIEHIRGVVGIEFQRTAQDSRLYLGDSLRLSGDTIGLQLSLIRRRLNNYIDPTSGHSLRLTHRFVGGWLGGDYDYMESEFESMYYYPLRFLEHYNTHLKLRATASKLMSYFGSAPPLYKRYRLGGPFNLRGYSANSISPRFVFWRTPFDHDETSFYPKGGDRQLVMQAEYYLPLISQAGMKALLFYDAGRVYDNNQSFTLEDLHMDVGFGIRWVTPMGPFRFEWAFPIEDDGSLGPYKMIFNIGY